MQAPTKLGNAPSKRSPEAAARVGEKACEIAAKLWPGTKWEVVSPLENSRRVEVPLKDGKA